MVEIPRFRRSGGLPGQIGGQRASPSETSAGALAGVLGAAAEGVGDIANELDRIQASKESAWISRATGDAEIFASELETRLEQEATEGAPGHVQAFESEWQGYQSEAMAAAPSRRSRDALEIRLNGVRTSAVKRRGVYQAQAELTKRSSDFDRALQGHVFAVGNDPSRLDEILGRVEGDLAAASVWMPAPMLTETSANMRAAVVASAVEGLIEREDYVNATMLTSGERGAALDANTREALTAKIDAAQKTSFVRDEGRRIGEAMTGAATLTNQNGQASEELVAALTWQESRSNPSAVSPKGATGLMQLMPDTAREVAAGLGVEYDEAKLKDPEYNRMLGTAYLNQQLARYDGNAVLALAAYNAGPGKVDEWIARFGDPRTGEVTMEEWRASIPFAETRGYIDAIEGRLGGALVSPEQLLAESVSDMEPTMRDRVAREARSVHSLTAAARGQAQAAEELRKAQVIAALEIGIEAGAAGHSEITKAYEAGDISPQEFSVLTRRKMAWDEAQDNKTKDLRKARARLAAGDTFNAYTSADRQAVDLLFEHSDGSVEAATALAGMTGIVPQKMVEDLRARMNSGDVAAYELAENLSRVAPYGMQSDDGKAVTEKVDEFRAQVRTGTDAQKAAQMASRTKQERQEAVSALPEVKKEFGKLTADDMLGDLEADGWTVDLSPLRHGRLMQDYEVAYMRAREAGYDHDAAREMAAVRLDRFWGYTEVNGAEDEVMRFPPERYFPPDPATGDHAWIRDQAVTLISEQTGAAPEGITLHSDIQTEADIRAGLPPRYKLRYQDEAGFLQEVLGYYRPDPRKVFAATEEETVETTAERKGQFRHRQGVLARNQARLERIRESGRSRGGVLVGPE